MPYDSVEKKRAYQKKYMKAWRIKNNKKIDELLGCICVICGRDYKVICHRKDGKEHSAGGNKMMVDVLSEPEEFVRLCWNCHKGVHWVMIYFGLMWKQIIERLIYPNSISNS